MNRMTNRCKNITLAKTSFRPVKITLYTLLISKRNLSEHFFTRVLFSFSTIMTMALELRRVDMPRLSSQKKRFVAGHKKL